MCVGERSAWNASTPISAGACRLFRRLGEERRHVAASRSSALPANSALPRSAAAAVERAGGRLRGRDRELVDVQRRQLRRAPCRRPGRPRVARSRSSPRPGTGPCWRGARRRTSPRRASRWPRRRRSSRGPSRSRSRCAGSRRRGRTRAGSACPPACRRGGSALPSLSRTASKRPGPQLAEHLLDGRLVDAEQIGERLQVGRERRRSRRR